MCVRAGIVLLASFSIVQSISLAASTWASADTPAVPVTGASASAAAGKTRFDVPAESLDKALRDLAQQASLNISYDPAQVEGLSAPALKGELSIDRALARILSGTRLRAVSINENTVHIVPVRHDADATSTHTGSERGDADLEEITVTGTHIRGNVDTPSPVMVFSRSDIDAAGATTVQQFLQILPQNNGGASENTILAIASNGRTNNTVNGSAPNLRGLGAEATLVLINGHRVAAGNSDGSFVDVSMIPVSAIDRIEILTDGASAIYGSDAVGGVVNIIMRTHYEGSETRAQEGSVTHGGMHNLTMGQTEGKDWGTGSALLTYQYFDQTSLNASSRDYLKSVVAPFYLLPEQVQHAAFANVDQQIAEDVGLHADAAYSHRSTYAQYSGGALAEYSATDSPSAIDGYGLTLGLNFKLPRGNTLDLTAGYSESDTQQEVFYSPSPVSALTTKTKTSIASFEANFAGSTDAWMMGPLRYAVGGQFRRETFGETIFVPQTSNTFYPSRNVDAAYGELHIPLIRAGNQSALEASLADRIERYSDFGSSNDPQGGLLWKPMENLRIRGTYGLSFKAPALYQLDPRPGEVAAVPAFLFNPAPQGTRNTLFVDGGNPNLQPEKARVWTLGSDFGSSSSSGPLAKLSFYHIVFSDRITDPGTTVCNCDAFSEAAVLGPSVVQLNPTPAEIDQLFSAPTLVNPFALKASDIHAIFDSRFKNLSNQVTSGLDFGLGYRVSWRDTHVETGVDGTRIFKYESQFANSPPTSYLNTTFNPVDLRFRARAIASRGGASGGLFVNFTNSYANNNTIPYAHVSSWTTLDGFMSYDFRGAAQPWDGLSLSLNVTNLADRAPPYVFYYSGYGITYDGVNANVMGRYISLRLQKRW